MPNQETWDDLVKELTEHYRSIISHFDEQSGRAILSGAKRAARGIMDPQASKAAYDVYSAVEKNLFPEASSPKKPGSPPEPRDERTALSQWPEAPTDKPKPTRLRSPGKKE